MASVWEELKRRNVVRVTIAYAIVSWLVLQLTDVLAPLLELPGWVARFIFFVLVIGFLLALTLSWAYELTPDGVKLEKDVDRSESITRATGRKLDFIIIGVLSVALVMFALDKFVWVPTDVETAVTPPPASSTEVATDEAPPNNTIAVLPFVNMSSDPEQEYFSDGLSEELLNLLARIPELRVTSRSSAFFYKGKDFQIEDVGRQLGVAYIMEGSVRRSGDTIRVTTQLIDVGTDTHVWSQTWDRNFADVFVIQDEIAAAAVDAMKVSILGETPRVAETTPEAYALYLLAKSHNALRTADSMRLAVNLLEQALAIDNQYAPAWTLFGDTYWRGSTLGAWEPHEGFPLAQSAAMEALKHDENSADAHLLLAIKATRYDYDLDTAQNEIAQALKLAPGSNEIRAEATLIDLYAGSTPNIGERVIELRDALKLDPLNFGIRLDLGMSLMYSDRIDEAISTYEELILLSPNVSGAHFRLGQALLAKGEFDAAINTFSNENRGGFQFVGRALAYQAIGNSEKAAEEFQQLIDLGNVWAAEIAMIYASLGETDQAFEWLERAFERRDQGLLIIIVEPHFENLYDDPRFALLIDRLGFTNYWERRKSERH